VASIRTFEDEGIVERARRLGDEVLGPGLRALADRHPSVGDVRGLGCFWAVELVRDRATRAPLVPFGAAGADAAPMAAVAAACRSGGAVPFVVGNRVHVCPPLVISDEDARHGIAVLDEALAAADTHVTT
jgi:taurine--2-oxoglutarate transaminase